MRAAHPGATALEWWFQDEARVGQQGTLTTVWGETGSRPEAVRQTEYQWVYLYAAVNPATGASSAMLAPAVNADYMSEHLRMVGSQVAPGAHAVLVLDGAGWHVAKALRVPANVTLLHLPPYSPKLNPVERVWAFLRGNYLSNRVYTDYDELFDVAGAAWNKLDEERLRSICRTGWIERAN
ncbi:MAG TPA: IS630 family transposase [Humisphaera sp.]